MPADRIPRHSRQPSGERTATPSMTLDEPNSPFERCFVLNHCPIAFVEEGGGNRLPDKLPVADRQALMRIC